jgi:hypothetical protein
MRGVRANRNGAQALHPCRDSISLFLLAFHSPRRPSPSATSAPWRSPRQQDAAGARLGRHAGAQLARDPGLQRPRPLPRGGERLHLRHQLRAGRRRPGERRHPARVWRRIGRERGRLRRDDSARRCSRGRHRGREDERPRAQGFLQLEARLHRRKDGPQGGLHLGPLLRRRAPDHARPRDRDDPPLVPGRGADHLHELLQGGFPDIFQIDLGDYQRTTFVSFKGTNSGAHFSPDGARWRWSSPARASPRST